MTSGTARPLVTFALFAYNQEAYIREAVEGAFAQTYEPLEIILSDDCSSDRTFEIMQEMAAAYDGPHAVRVRRSEVNRGLLNHINEAAREFAGSITVVAAGDDISKPDRTALITEVFRGDPQTKAVYSDFHQYGEELEKIDSEGSVNRITRAEIFYNIGGVGTGATYAYATPVFGWPWSLSPDLLSEDKLLPARACLLGAVKYLEIGLVDYRVHDAGLHQELKRSGRLARQNRAHIMELNRLLVEAEKEGLIGFQYRLVLSSLMHGRFLLSRLERCRILVVGVVCRIAGRVFIRAMDNTFRRTRRVEDVWRGAKRSAASE